MLRSIAFIRFVHTAIFAFFNVIMAVLLYEVVADKISILTWIAVALFAIEAQQAIHLQDGVMIAI